MKLIEEELFLTKEDCENFNYKVKRFILEDITRQTTDEFELKRVIVCLSPQKFSRLISKIERGYLEYYRNDPFNGEKDKVKHDMEKFGNIQYEDFIEYMGVTFVEVFDKSAQNTLLVLNTKIEYQVRSY